MSFSIQFSSSKESKDKIENVFKPQSDKNGIQNQGPRKMRNQKKYDKLLSDALHEDESLLDFDGFLQSKAENNQSIESTISTNKTRNLVKEEQLLPNLSREHALNSNPTSNLFSKDIELKSTPSAPSKPKYILDMMESVQKRKETLKEIKDQKLSKILQESSTQVYFTKSYKEELEKQRKEDEKEIIRIQELKNRSSAFTESLMRGKVFKQLDQKDNIKQIDSKIASQHINNDSQERDRKSDLAKMVTAKQKLDISLDNPVILPSSLSITENFEKQNLLQKRKERPDCLSTDEIDAARERYLKRLAKRLKREEI